MTCTNVSIVLKVFTSGENLFYCMFPLEKMAKSRAHSSKNVRFSTARSHSYSIYNKYVHVTYPQHPWSQFVCNWVEFTTPISSIVQVHTPRAVTSISCIIEHFINYLEPVFIPIIKAAEIERYDLYECDYSLESIYFR